MRAHHYVFFLLIICSTSSYAQFELTPAPRNNSSSKPSYSRTKELTPKQLPFWDDFSFPTGSSPVDSLWKFSSSVWVNKGMGINAPSIGVATFDGLDSLGKPYNVTDVLAKGFADHMTSLPLRMDLIDASLRQTLFINFFYQYQGNGEAPDPGDSLFLQFKNKDKKWETVWSVNSDGTLNRTVFTEVNVLITADRFYHEDFQFRFRNFSRLSGPYDTWNLDYIFVSNGELPANDEPPFFADRTVVSSFSSLIKNYTAMPLHHFAEDPSAFLIQPSIIINNQRKDQVQGSGQPVSYYSSAVIDTKKGDAISRESLNLDSDLSIGNQLVYNVQRNLTLTTIPSPTLFDTSADSISVRIKINVDTRDNIIRTPTQGDYIPRLYNSIDFRVNDSTSTVFTLADYYAYDDGTAEYGAGIKGFGVQVMYKFDMQTTGPDTLVGVQMYFPRFGDESSQLIQLQVFKDLNGTVGSTLHQESVTVQRSEDNKFTYYKFNRFVGVKGTFYVGWKQSTAASISVGLDKNTNSNKKIFFNTSSVWQQDTTNINGSLMIRPVFGKGGAVTGLPENSSKTTIFPNPNEGRFFLPIQAEQIRVVDITGREVYFTIENTTDYKQLELSGTAGIYIVRYVLDKSIRTEKIMVLR